MNLDSKTFQNNQVLRFLSHIESYSGASPTFKIVYMGNSSIKQGIYLTESSTGFIKMLVGDNALVNLKDGMISVYFM